jgi:hypothetical protein
MQQQGGQPGQTGQGPSTRPSGGRTNVDKPNQEAGVTPRRGAQGHVKPFEVSPETGREITAMAQKFTEELIKIQREGSSVKPLD